MWNEEGIDERKVVTRFNFKSYNTVFDIVVGVCTTRVVEC